MPRKELTARQLQVTKLLAVGKTIGEVAALLNLSPKTVDVHKGNIFLKTGCRSLVALARWALRENLVTNE